MKGLFPGYYRLTEQEFAALWKSALFVLDANVLLNLYRYPEKAREDLLKAFQKISSRLWVPYQAALEYQRNRQSVIADQRSRFWDVRKILESAQHDTENEFQQLQLKKRHSNINPDDFIQNLGKLIADFTSELDALEKAHSENIEKDELRDRIEKLLETRIGPRPSDQKTIDDLYKEGEQRFAKQIPPGYMDRKKDKDKQGEDFSYGGINYKRKFGDFIVWSQLMEHAKASALKDVIFVTDDDKEDWWWSIESQGKKKLGPRPELVEEVTRLAGVERFHMYSSEQFLEFADTYLKVKVSKDSIAQVTESKKQARDYVVRGAEVMIMGRMTERGVFNWLSKLYPQFPVIENQYGFPDFVVEIGSQGLLGVEVTMVRGSLSLMPGRLDRVFRGHYEVLSGNLHKCIFVFVLMEDTDQGRVVRTLRTRIKKMPAGVEIQIGRLAGSNDEPVFEPTGEPLVW